MKLIVETNRYNDDYIDRIGLVIVELMKGAIPFRVEYSQ